MDLIATDLSSSLLEYFRCHALLFEIAKKTHISDLINSYDYLDMVFQTILNRGEIYDETESKLIKEISSMQTHINLAIRDILRYTNTQSVGDAHSVIANNAQRSDMHMNILSDRITYDSISYDGTVSNRIENRDMYDEKYTEETQVVTKLPQESAGLLYRLIAYTISGGLLYQIVDDINIASSMLRVVRDMLLHGVDLPFVGSLFQESVNIFTAIETKTTRVIISTVYLLYFILLIMLEFFIHMANSVGTISLLGFSIDRRTTQSITKKTGRKTSKSPRRKSE